MRFINRTTARPGASVAMALALACTGIVATAAFEAPAMAQREKKAKAPKTDYSKAFVGAFQATDAASREAAPDWATIKASIPSIQPTVSTADDKMAFGDFLYRVGRGSDDTAMQRQGVALMIESGKIEAERLGAYNFLSGQLAYQAEDWAAARQYMKAAIAAGYSENEPEAIVSEAYFNEGLAAEGLAYLMSVIDARRSAGVEVSDSWLRRGLTVAYEENLLPQAVQFSGLYAMMYPSPESWNSAIAIQRNLVDFDSQETLDLLRLARRANALINERDYVDYIEAADFRRLPAEVKAVTDAGLAANLLRNDDVMVSEAKTGSNARLASDRAELPALERDARSGSSLATVMAAGDAFLSYGEAAKAEEFFTKALTLPGVEQDRTLMRLGIAQADQGKYAEAIANFDKVGGKRKTIASLWKQYAQMKSAPAGA